MITILHRFYMYIHFYLFTPVMIQLIKICGLPVERYFNPETMREESEQRQRVSHKLKLCPEEYLPIIEGDVYKRQGFPYTKNFKGIETVSISLHSIK